MGKLFIKCVLNKKKIDIDDIDIPETEFEDNEEYISKNENNITIKNFFTDKTKVPDVHRGYVCIDNGKAFYCSQRNIPKPKPVKGEKLKNSIFIDDLPKDKSPIVLLLESPHRNEYGIDENDELYPIAPAQGKTGYDIQNCLSTFLEKAIKENRMTGGQIKSGKKYPLIICEPIPWQTSLAHLLNSKVLNKKIRNAVWKALWESKVSNKKVIKGNFRKKLKSYNPVLVINACTSDLTDKVEDVLKDVCIDGKKLNRLRCNHPCINWPKGKFFPE